jgi:ankyrin repeat protein/uncharacterized membrane protein YfcA
MTIDVGLAALAFVAMACLASGFAHGALGFGFPMVATPLVALVLDIKLAIALLAPISLVVVLISAFRGGGLGALLATFWVLPLFMALGAWLGTQALIAAPPAPFVLALALVILLYLNLERLGTTVNQTVRRRARLFGVAFGFVAGIFEAVANVAGPILLIYFMLLGLAPLQIVQTLNLCFSFGKASQVLSWVAADAIPPATWAAVGALTLPSVAALFAGMRLRERIDAATYRRWLRGALWAAAGLLIGQFAFMAQAHAQSGTQAANEQLFAAIEEGKELVAEGLIQRRRADASARNAAGEPVLHVAVEKGMKALARVLLQAGADLRARTRNGETALHLAALHSEPFFLDLLLAAGADPRARNDDGESVLFWAALTGHAELVARLLERGADPDVRDLKGNTPLHGAADGGHEEAARLLAGRMREPGVRNREGRTARDLALAKGHEELAKLLD